MHTTACTCTCMWIVDEHVELTTLGGKSPARESGDANTLLLAWGEAPLAYRAAEEEEEEGGEGVVLEWRGGSVRGCSDAGEGCEGGEAVGVESRSTALTGEGTEGGVSGSGLMPGSASFVMSRSPPSETTEFSKLLYWRLSCSPSPPSSMAFMRSSSSSILKQTSKQTRKQTSKQTSKQKQRSKH